MPRQSVLIVEDHRMISDMLKLFLITRGFTVHVAENGAQGLELCLAHHPDLVITDNTMPLMTGLELIRKIRSQDDVRGTKIIFVSGDGGNIESAGLAAGANSFLAKPYDLGELLRLIAKELT